MGGQPRAGAPKKNADAHPPSLSSPLRYLLKACSVPDLILDDESDVGRAVLEKCVDENEKKSVFCQRGAAAPAAPPASAAAPPPHRMSCRVSSAVGRGGRG